MKRIVNEKILADIEVSLVFERCSEEANVGWELTEMEIVGVGGLNVDHLVIGNVYDTAEVEDIVGESVE